jgi:hypothetical protein
MKGVIEVIAIGWGIIVLIGKTGGRVGRWEGVVVGIVVVVGFGARGQGEGEGSMKMTFRKN